jgi:two-component system chemotaxis response regulator CheB
VSAATVLIADRSMAVRAALRRLLETSPGIEVVADAADGERAVLLAIEKSPHAVVLDLNLPALSGRDLVEKLVARTSASVFVLTPRRNRQSTRLAMALHGLGVVAVYPKPEVPQEWSALGQALRETLLDLGRRQKDTTSLPVKTRDARVSIRRLRYVGVGGSTGGPGAIYEMLSNLGRPIRVGVAIVQHISGGFEGAFSEWLASELRLDVGVARNGEHLAVGKVRIAPADQHLSIDANGVLCLDPLTAPVNGHRPAVEMLFRSLLKFPRDRVAAVLLSGMGADGATAMGELRSAGILTIAQNRASCAVFGMPRAAIEARAATFDLAPNGIGHLLARGEAMCSE